MAIAINVVGSYDGRDLRRAQRELDALKKSADTLQNRMRRVGDSFGAVGASMKRVGGTMSRYVTAPLAAVGVTSIKSAMDFETSMARIEGLVGVASSEIGELASAARELGPSYGVSANEAGEALFFITSAGLRGATAIETLDNSLKAAAVGLGDTATVADLLTSTINAYGEANLDASEATDVLVNSVRLGKLMPEELAQSMGMVLPVASAMGVEFHEVGAAFAAMSRTGTNASTAATQLRQILATILNPTTEAREELDKYGLSAEGLRRQLREDGLLSVLQTLTSTLGLNDDAIARVFGNIRALSGVLDLMGSNAQATGEIFEGMASSVGVADDAFGAVADTAAYQFKVAWEEARAALMDVGTDLLPILTDLAKSLQGLVDDWNDLTDEQQRNYLKWGAIAAVAGPAIVVLGNLAIAIQGVSAALIFLSAHPIIAAVTALGFVVAGLASAYGKTSEAEQQAHTDAQRNRAAQNETAAAYMELGRQARLAADDTRALAEESRTAARSAFLARRETAKWTDAMADNELRRFEMLAGRDRANRAAEEEARLLAELEESLGNVAKSYEGATEKIVDLDGELTGLLRTVNETYAGTTVAGDAFAQYARDVLAAGEISESTAAQIDGLASALRSELSSALSDAESDLGSAQRAFDSYRDSISNGIRQGNTLADAFDAQTAARGALTEAELDYARAAQSGDADAIAEAAYNYELALNSAANFNDFLAQNARTAERFADQIDALRLAGASLSVVQQIAQLGAQTGGRIITELLAGGAAAINEANRLTEAVERASMRAGNAAAQQFYGAGVRAAQALADGIRSRIGELDALLEQVVQRISSAFDGAGARLPTSNVAPSPTPAPIPTPSPTPIPTPTPLPPAQLGSWERRFAAGGIGGLRFFADGGLVMGPTLGVVGEAGPELIVPLDKVGSMGAPTTVNVTVTSADPQAVVEAIRRYTRGNGPLGQVVNL